MNNNELSPSLMINVISGNPGLLSTGGWDDTGTSVELYSLQSQTSCRLASLPDGERGHSQHQNILCGVGPGNSQCWSLRDGTWSTSHQLDGDRFGSSVSDGLVVLGGGKYGGANTTAVLATTDGEVRQLFTLQYRTK